MPGPDYKVNEKEPHNQALGASIASLSICVAWRCPEGTQFLFYCLGWPLLRDCFLETFQLLTVQLRIKSLAAAEHLIEDDFLLFSPNREQNLPELNQGNQKCV